MGWGNFLDKIIDKLPIQGRVERWKNEIENLQKERKELIKSDCNDKTIRRIITIDKRIVYLVQLLRNKT